MEIETAKLNAKASSIEAAAQIAETKATQSSEVKYKADLANLELNKSEALAKVESSKFKSLVSAIGTDTIKGIAKAGPEIQAKLLGGLGLKGYLMTDGNSPINLFNAARGMVGQ